jgi:hypothetical protein
MVDVFFVDQNNRLASHPQLHRRVPRPIRRLPVVSALFLSLLSTSYAYLASARFRPDKIGRYELQDFTGLSLPPECSDFSEACAAEAAGDYSTAIQLYEDKYPMCGDHGWNITGHASGTNDFVVFKRTPCGLHVAIKAAHTGKECRIIKQLSEGQAHDACPGCFPRYYHLSNFTNACYSEFVESAPVEGLHGEHRSINHTKALFLQAVHMIRVLRAQNLEHRDLSFRNILGRHVVYADGSKGFQLVMIDFACAKPLNTIGYLDEKKTLKNSLRQADRRDRRLDGNGAHTDLVSVACTFYHLGYKYTACRQALPPLIDDPTSLKHALVRVMLDYDMHDEEPDYTKIRDLVDGVQTF